MKQDNKYISIINSSRMAKLAVEDIEVVEQEGRKLHIYTSTGEYDCYGSVDSIAEYVSGNGFYRPMKSMILNFDKIAEICEGEVIFQSGRKMWLGRNNFFNVKRAFKYYLMKYPPFVAGDTYSMVAENSALDESSNLLQKSSK